MTGVTHRLATSLRKYSQGWLVRPLAKEGGDALCVPGFDYATVQDGARGVRFIERAIASSQEKSWILL